VFLVMRRRGLQERRSKHGTIERGRLHSLRNLFSVLHQRIETHYPFLFLALFLGQSVVMEWAQRCVPLAICPLCPKTNTDNSSGASGIHPVRLQEN
jgi:hypothetical protein